MKIKCMFFFILLIYNVIVTDKENLIKQEKNYLLIHLMLKIILTS